MFNYNRADIAKNLCENRDNPQMRCCGKCYLKKQLNKVNDEQNRTGSLSMKWEKGSLSVFIIPVYYATIKNFITNDVLKHRPNYILALVSQPPSSIFHPAPL
jgi:hypothetical protein